MKIIYTDTANAHDINLDVDKSDEIYYLILKHAIHKAGFDVVHIDLRSESVEEVHCYDSATKRRVLAFGGASAWNIYRQVAAILPEIDYHTSGRPAVIL
ncbi:MAG TPA: hypothetical protein PK228_01490 [Saprospiraceae bacterium]|nr:hypothetical protein [Saprospiraceae bacterium]